MPDWQVVHPPELCNNQFAFGIGLEIHLLPSSKNVETPLLLKAPVMLMCLQSKYNPMSIVLVKFVLPS